MAKKKKRGWAHKPTGTKGTKTVGQVVKEDRALDSKKKGSLKMEEKMEILDLYAAGETDTHLIGQKVGRSAATVQQFLWRYRSTTKTARMRIEAGAETLADRIVETANVTEALEVMDRLDILAKKRDKSAPITSFALIIGAPTLNDRRQGAANEIPVPSQKQIDDAIEAEVKVVG